MSGSPPALGLREGGIYGGSPWQRKVSTLWPLGSLVMGRDRGPKIPFEGFSHSVPLLSKSSSPGL